MDVRIGDYVYVEEKYIGVVSKVVKKSSNISVKCHDGVRRDTDVSNLTLICSVDDVLKQYEEVILNASR